MDVSVLKYKIAPNKPLPISNKYNIIIALMASFYLYNSQWDINAFSFFLDDIDTHLSDKAIAFFELNYNYGQPYNMEIYDCLIDHGYRICGIHCIKTVGLPETEEKFVFDSVSRMANGFKMPFSKVWRFTNRASIARCAGQFLNKIKKFFPDANDICAHEGLCHCIEGNFEQGIDLLEKSFYAKPQYPGYAIIASRAYMSKNDKCGAIQLLKKGNDICPDSEPIQNWLDLALADEKTFIPHISPFWEKVYSSLYNNELFLNEMVALPKDVEPVGWYLRKGLFALPATCRFAPSVYLGLNEDIFKMGIEPFYHYLIDGKTENRII